MKDKTKNRVVTLCFLAIIFGFMLSNLVMSDAQLSFSERRKLAQAPEFTFNKLFSGKLFEEFEEYSLDQFVLRDVFRGIKAYGTYYLWHQKDNNALYIKNGRIIKMEYKLNEQSILNAAKKLNAIYNKYLQGKNVNYAIIPDKNYFIASENGYLSMDYNKLQEIMKQNVANMDYINLFNSLKIEDYYNTDIHWSQDKILDIADVIFKGMGNDARASDNQYIRKELNPFYGSYYGQAAIRIHPDDLVYLTNDLLDKAAVYDYETKKYSKVYMPDKFGGMDSYDVFLSGAKSLITIDNPESTGKKELILFRDSFGSSIAPLLLSGYSKITLVDLRYVSTDLLGSTIDFTQDQDVLFLYNTLVLNNSYMLK